MGDFFKPTLPTKWSASNIMSEVHSAIGMKELSPFPGFGLLGKYGPPAEGDLLRYDNRSDAERGDAGSRWSFMDFRDSANKPTKEDIAYAEALEAQEQSNQQARIDLDASLAGLYEEEEKRKRQERFAQISGEGSFEAPL